MADYIEKRMEWFDKLRGHLVDMPYKERSDIPEKVLYHYCTGYCRSGIMVLVLYGKRSNFPIVQVKASVKQRFKEIRQARVEPICKCELFFICLFKRETERDERERERRREERERNARKIHFRSVVSKCTTARDQDIMDFFDDAAEVIFHTFLKEGQ